jgi:hypothetical protein
VADGDRTILEYLKQIEPTGAQKEGARRSHSFLRDVLCTGNFESRVKTSYLSGSYARGTAIAPLDDVDIVFVINSNAWKARFFSSLPSPTGVLESFARAVRYRYPESSVRVQNRSICLQMHHLDIDLVPAIEVDASASVIWVPDVREDGWIRSAPKIHAATASELNRRHDGLFKPLVKLLKAWNSNLPRTASLRSFAMETLATRLFTSHKFANLEEAVSMFFDFIAWINNDACHYRWANRCGISANFWGIAAADIAGTGSNVLGKLTWERWQRFAEHASRSRDRLIEAKAARRPETARRRLCEALRIVDGS